MATYSNLEKRKLEEFILREENPETQNQGKNKKKRT